MITVVLYAGVPNRFSPVVSTASGAKAVRDMVRLEVLQVNPVPAAAADGGVAAGSTAESRLLLLGQLARCNDRCC